MEPPVSDPRDAGTRPAATAAADPLEEPPGTREGSQGLRVKPKALFSPEEPIANSSHRVLPMMIAPASSRRCTAVAVYGLWKCSSIREPQVVWPKSVTMLSLTAIGTPASGPGFSPWAILPSIRPAARSAPGR